MPANTDFLPEVVERESVNQSQPARMLRVDDEDGPPSRPQGAAQRQQRPEKQAKGLSTKAQQDLIANQQRLEKQLEMLTKHLAEPTQEPEPGRRSKSSNKRPTQEQPEDDARSHAREDGYDDDEDHRGHSRGRAQEMRGRTYEDQEDRRDRQGSRTRQIRGRAYEDDYDDEGDRHNGRNHSRSREARGRSYDGQYDEAEDRHRSNNHSRAREKRSPAQEDEYDPEDNHYRDDKRNRTRDMRGSAHEDKYVHDNHHRSRKQAQRNDYEDGDEEDSEDGKHRKHDEHDRDEHRHVTSFQRVALRLISWRRDETMKQLHGDTGLHMAAWIAEVITCFLFTCACLVMLALWARHVNEEAFVNTSFVTAIAAMTYFAKACHMGDVMFLGHVVPIARYVDWITTTPLMLYEVCHIAHATASMTIMVIMCDLLMLATGIIAAVMPWKKHKGLKQVWFILSCLFYVLMLVVIQTDVAYKAKKQIPVAQNLFNHLKYLTIIVWSFYPIIVAMGRAHLGLITKSTEDIMLCVMDVVAKIGMEGLIVGSCFNGCIEAGDGH